MGSAASSAQVRIKREHLVDILERAGAATATVCRAHLVAYPMRRVVLRVRERDPVPIGLVERHLMEVFRRFGPGSPADIAGFLGLDDALVGRLCSDLEEAGALERLSDGRLRSDGDGDSESRLARLVEHERTFLIDGLTGGMLPASWPDHLMSLSLTPASKAGEFALPDGMSLTVRGHAAPERGALDLKALEVELQDPARIKALELPARIDAVLPPGPVEDVAFWVPAFLMVHDDGQLSAYAWKCAGHQLPLPQADAARFVTTVFERIGTASLQPTPNFEVVRAQLAKLLSAAALRPGPRPSEAYLDNSGEVIDVVALLRGEARWIGDLLAGRSWWDSRHGTLLRIRPGGPSVAKAVCLLLAVRRLRRSARKFEEGLAVDSYLAAIHAEVSADSAPGVEVPDIDLGDVIDLAMELNDTELEDIVEAHLDSA